MFSSQDAFFYYHLEEYKRTNSFNNSRIKQDLTAECETRNEYKGREVFEMLQNAEDQDSDYVVIEVESTKHILRITNGGSRCIPFSEGGFCSIMMADNSPKTMEKKALIGSKGLGFRSLLNWSSMIAIISNGVRCEFSREIATDYWGNIKKTLSNDLVKKHEEFAQIKTGTRCPVSILSIPNVSDVKDPKLKETTIEVCYTANSANAKYVLRMI